MNSIYRIAFRSKNPHPIQSLVAGPVVMGFFLYGAVQERWIIKMSGFSPIIMLWVTHAFCWLFVVMGLCITYGSVEEWVRQRANGIMLEVTTEGILLPRGFAGLKTHRILYEQISRVEEEVPQGSNVIVLHLVTRSQTFAISSDWFPDSEHFTWFKEHLHAHVPRAVS